MTEPLDTLGTGALVDRIIEGQAHVASVVSAAGTTITEAVELLVRAWTDGGRMLLCGAGTSGRLAVMEAAELPGTFGIPEVRVLARLAGGGDGQLVGSDGAEDDTDQAREDMVALAVARGDVLVAVAASGTTPYTVEAARAARAAGAGVVSITNATGSPLGALADVAIELPVGDEVLGGSTRLAAGTAQKMALNTLTTATMTRLGHVHDRYMIDVVPANEKLMRRVTGIVAACTGVSAAVASEALRRCAGNARAAVVLLETGATPELAQRVVHEHRTTREALEAARGSTARRS